MKEYTVKAPFFTGFYGYELFEPDELTALPETHPELYGELDNRKLAGKFCEAVYGSVDWKKTHENISGQLVNQVYQDIFGNYAEKVEFDSLYSPKYYNYGTDEIYIKVTLSNAQLKAIELFCFEEAENGFGKHLQRYYTSRDGFISFIPNNTGEFKAEYRRLKNMKNDEMTVCLEIMLEFLFSGENNGRDVSPYDLECMWEYLAYWKDFDEKEIAENY